MDKRPLSALKKIGEREKDRLGSKASAYTKAFSTRQKFGAASDVRHVSVEELSDEELSRLLKK